MKNWLDLIADIENGKTELESHKGWAFCEIKDSFNITMGQSLAGESINGVKGIEFHQGKIYFTESYLSQSRVLNLVTKYG